MKTILAKYFAIIVVTSLIANANTPDESPDIPPNFRRENLVAWCIVPFDAKNRSPEARAQLLTELGLTKCAYDWRKEHVPEFEQEMIAYRDAGIEYTAFWEQHEEAFRLFRKHQLHPQIWKMIPKVIDAGQDARIADAVRQLTPLVEECAAMQSKIGLYNHGSWGGEPKNLTAVCEAFRKAGHPHVGIVYNFHHAHEHIADFPKSFQNMLPYLLCVNLNGMVELTDANTHQKIQTIGRGEFEHQMIRTVIDSGYDGPIGILGHVASRDVGEVLKENIEGLEFVLGARTKPAWMARLDEADYLAKWTPKAREDSKYAYESETDADWVDDRFSSMDTGPTFCNSIIMPAVALEEKKPAKTAKTKKFNKAIALRGDVAKNLCHLLFDTEQVNLVGAWSGEFIDIPDARFGILKIPSVKGPLQWAEHRDMRWHIVDGTTHDGESATARPLKKNEFAFDGFYRYQDGVGMAYTLADTKIIDVPRAFDKKETTVIARSIRRSPGEATLRLPLCRTQEDEISKKDLMDGTIGESVQDSISFQDDKGRQVTAVSNSKSSRFVMQNDTLYLELGPSVEIVDFLTTLIISAEQQSASQHAQSVKSALQDLKSSRPGFDNFATNVWGEPIETAGSVSSDADAAFVIDTITLPLKNRFDALMFTSGFDFLDATRAFVCTIHGDVWLVDGIDEELDRVTWQRFATGLYQPLGLKVVDGKPIVLCRDRLTRLHDFNGDGEADFYENFNDDLVVTGQPHGYAMSLETDPEGNFYFTKSGGTPPHGGTMLKLSPNGDALSVLATGYRHANGMGVSSTGVITSADNEGNWIPSTRIDIVRDGGFYGHMPTHRRDTEPKTYDEPLCWVPRAIDNSAGGQTWVPRENQTWKSLSERMLHFSFGRCTVNVVLMQPPSSPGGLTQAAIYRLDVPPFQSGSMRGRFHPSDGHLYACGLDGWQTAAIQDGHFQRVRATGRPFYQPTHFSVLADRIEVTFDQPLEKESAMSISNWTVQRWNYRWTKEYGSDHYSVSDPDTVGHDNVTVNRIELSDDQKTVGLFIEDLGPVMQMRVAGSIQSASGRPVTVELFNTIHAAN